MPLPKREKRKRLVFEGGGLDTDSDAEPTIQITLSNDDDESDSAVLPVTLTRKSIRIRTSDQVNKTVNRNTDYNDKSSSNDEDDDDDFKPPEPKSVSDAVSSQKKLQVKSSSSSSSASKSTNKRKSNEKDGDYDSSNSGNSSDGFFDKSSSRQRLVNVTSFDEDHDSDSYDDLPFKSTGRSKIIRDQFEFLSSDNDNDGDKMVDKVVDKGNGDVAADSVEKTPVAKSKRMLTPPPIIQSDRKIDSIKSSVLQPRRTALQLSPRMDSAVELDPELREILENKTRNSGIDLVSAQTNLNNNAKFTTSYELTVEIGIVTSPSAIEFQIGTVQQYKIRSNESFDKTLKMYWHKQFSSTPIDQLVFLLDRKTVLYKYSTPESLNLPNGRTISISVCQKSQYEQWKTLQAVERQRRALESNFSSDTEVDLCSSEDEDSSPNSPSNKPDKGGDNLMYIRLNTKGSIDRLQVAKTISFENIIQLYREKHQIESNIKIKLKFDGEVLDDDDTLDSLDPDEDDQLDVLIKQ